jgi:hypothetical protein
MAVNKLAEKVDAASEWDTVDLMAEVEFQGGIQQEEWAMLKPHQQEKIGTIWNCLERDDANGSRGVLGKQGKYSLSRLPIEYSSVGHDLHNPAPSIRVGTLLAEDGAVGGGE